jgi:putative flippase GtrA
MQRFRALSQHRFARFLIAGGSGAALNLLITFLLTRFVLGASAYFTAFLIGTVVNFLYNFTLYTIAIFKTREKHARRFIVFTLYSIVMTALQLSLVRAITGAVGEGWYLVVIAFVILVGACFNYLVFKSSIFKTEQATVAATVSAPLPPN